MNRSLKSSGHTSADCRLVCSDASPAASRSALGRALTAAGRNADALATYERGAKVAERRGDQQAAKEMRVFSKRLQRAERAAGTQEDKSGD